MKNKAYVSVIIPAGGSGSRMKSAENKLLMKLGDLSVIERTLLAFDKTENVDEIIVAIPSSDKDVFENIIKNTVKNKEFKIVSGGADRESSVYNGLLATNKSAEIIAVHDGARPLIESEEIDKIIIEAYLFGAVCAGNAVKNTVKIMEGERIVKTLERSTLFSATTPQVFRAEILKNAFEKFKDRLSEFTDDSSLVEALGVEVKTFFCDEKNIKITTPEDIKTAEKFLMI